MKRTRLETIAADGSCCVFYYEVEHCNTSGPILQFRVYDSHTATDKYFEWVIKCMNHNIYRSIVVEKHDDARYGAKGIPDVLFLRVAKELGIIIQSSKLVKANTEGNISEFSNSRSVEADRMWRRLRQKGIASYDPNRDIYIIDSCAKHTVGFRQNVRLDD